MNTILFLFVVFLSCLLQGITGYGFALLLAPIGYLLFDQQKVTIVLILISFILNLYLSFKIKAKIKKNIIIRLVIAGIFGVPIGVLSLKLISPEILKLIAGSVAIIFTFILFKPNFKLKINNNITNIIGFLTGFLQSSIGLSGPPVIFTLIGYGLKPGEIRKNLAIIFFVLSVLCLSLYLLNNMITANNLILGIFSVPFAVIGGWLGNRVSANISKKLFQLISVVVIFITSVMTITSALKNLF